REGAEYMALTETEAVAGLRVLVAIAQADGTIHEAEKASLTAALDGVKLPAGMTVDSLLAEKPDLDKQLAAVSGADARGEIFKSAYGMAHADGECTSDEQALLDRIQKTWEIPEQHKTLVTRIFSEAKDTVLPSNIEAISDPARRKKEINEDVI